MGNSQTTATYEPPTKGKTWKAYCAIDVGAVSCGYAYSFDDIKDIWVNKNWGESQGFFTLRSPSALLYDENDVPDSFGYQAIEKYLAMSRDESKRVTFCYDGLLKSKLFNKAKTRDSSEIETAKEAEEYESDDQLEEDPFLEEESEGAVAAAADAVEDEKHHKAKRSTIENKVDLTVLLAKHCLADIENKYSGYRSSPDEVLWILIVPYSMELPDRTIFRKKMEEGFRASFEKKVHEEKYTIAITTTLESMWLAVKDPVSEKLESKFQFRGKKKEKAVIIVHCGATRTEISLHKKKSGAFPVKDEHLGLGGNLINRLFEEYLIQSLPGRGKQFIKECKQKYLASWLDLMLQFERARKGLHYGDNHSISMDINFGFAEAYTEFTGKHLMKSMKQKPRDEDSGKRFTLTSSGKLYLSGVLTKAILENLVMPIMERILSTTDKEYDIRGIILTGGYGESKTLKEYITAQAQENKILEKITLYTPAESTMLHVRGAITSAKLKCVTETAYAIAYYGKHTQKIALENVEGLLDNPVVLKIFPIIGKGQNIEIGKTYERGPLVLTSFNEVIWFDLYELHYSLKVGDNANKYLLLKGYEDNAFIDRLEFKVPKQFRGMTHYVHVKVTMDRYAFEVELNLVSTKPFMKTSLTSGYTYQTTKVKHKDRAKGSAEEIELQSVYQSDFDNLQCQTVPNLSSYDIIDAQDL